MQPLWARVDANRTKLTVFVGAFIFGSALLLALALVALPGGLIGWAGVGVGEIASAAAYWRGYAIAVGGAFVAFLLIGSLIAAVQLSNAEDWVRNRFKGTPLDAGTEPMLESTLADMALAAGLSATPMVLVLDEGSANAFAVGTIRKRAVIGVTRGMLTDFSEDELRAVMATLVARIVAGDIMFGTALAALMGPIKAIRDSRASAGGVASGCADAGCSDPGCGNSGCGGGDGCVDIGGGDDAGAGCLGLIAVIVFFIVVAVITYAALVTAAWIVTIWGRALNRTSYEKADAEGMLLLKDPAPMISALRKAIFSATTVGSQDPSYDGIFYAPTSGTPRVERAERRRFERLCEVLGVDGLAASLESPADGMSAESEAVAQAADASADGPQPPAEQTR
jgi:Zn-dependent protease with chaperone function